jgi:hypothetical protein
MVRQLESPGDADKSDAGARQDGFVIPGSVLSRDQHKAQHLSCHGHKIGHPELS